MSVNKLLFQYCPKIVVLRDDTVLLCRRNGEADLDGIFSFIGGKMERSDASIVDALHREKTEEVGEAVQLRLLATFSANAEFTKADGNRMILPHFLAYYNGGDINLSDEYSEYQWVKLDELKKFEPLIDNIPEVCSELRRLERIADAGDFVTI